MGTKHANIGFDRTGGRRDKATVKPPVVHFSGDFIPASEPPLPRKTPDLAAAAKERGFSDGETPQALHMLGTIGYQHASSYFPLFQSPDGAIESGSSMRGLHRAILFDRKLQALVIEYTGLFELKFRTQYSLAMSQLKGAFAHRNPRNFKDADHFKSFLSRYEDEFNRQLRNRNREIDEAYARYGDAPLWLAVEIMSFGTLSMLYKNTKAKSVKASVAKAFDVSVEEFESWTAALSGVRNTCAHFGRLAGSTLARRPKRIPGISADNGNPFYALLVLEHLFRNCCVFDDDSTLSYNLALARDAIQLFAQFEDILPRCKIPVDWVDLLMQAALNGAGYELANDFANRGDEPGTIRFRINLPNGESLYVGYPEGTIRKAQE